MKRTLFVVGCLAVLLGAYAVPGVVEERMVKAHYSESQARRWAFADHPDFSRCSSCHENGLQLKYDCLMRLSGLR